MWTETGWGARSEGPIVSGRERLLADLIYLRRPVAQVVADLAKIPLASEEELITVTAADVRRLLLAYLAGSVTERECEAWADEVEFREGIAIDDDPSEVLRETIFNLSTPELQGELDRDRAREWLDELERAMTE